MFHYTTPKFNAGQVVRHIPTGEIFTVTEVNFQNPVHVISKRGNTYNFNANQLEKWDEMKREAIKD